MTTKKPRLHVKSLADAMQQLRLANETVTTVTKQKLALEEEVYAANKAQRSAEHDVEVTRANFGDLKKKLYDAEIELARLRGFVERVREDDAVADPLVEVEDAMGKRQVTKRFPSNRPIGVDQYVGMAVTGGYDTYGREQAKLKHWTSY